MAHAVTHGLHRIAAARPRFTARARPRDFVDDPLGAVCGIMFGTLLSVLVFWLPLVAALKYA